VNDQTTWIFFIFHIDSDLVLELLIMCRVMIAGSSSLGDICNAPVRIPLCFPNDIEPSSPESSPLSKLVFVECLFVDYVFRGFENCVRESDNHSPQADGICPLRAVPSYENGSERSRLFLRSETEPFLLIPSMKERLQSPLNV
jgi:hypothetical protein